MVDIELDYLKEELLQCRRCGLCRNAVYESRGFDGICPVWKNSSGFETSFMRGKIMVALGLLEGVLERTAENAESLYQCTLCGNCTAICPSEFEPAKALEQVRHVLNAIPNDVRDAISEKIIAHDNPYDEDNSVRRKWIEELGLDIPAKGDTLYYVGCTAGMRIQDVAKDTARILKAAGVDFSIMEDEPCCGSVMLRTGRTKEAEDNAKKVGATLRSTGAKQIIVSCAGCLKTLREDYPRMGIEIPEVLHIVEYAERLIKEGKLRPNRLPRKYRTAYHDPCHMGRELGIYDSPRYVLKSIPGVELVEMETHHEQAMCCGAGGGLRSYDSDLAKRIGADRVRDAEESEADVLATACPFCEHNLGAGASLIDSNVDVIDVVTLLARSLEEE